MTRFSSETNIPSCKVTTDLVKSTEDYLIEKYYSVATRDNAASRAHVWCVIAHFYSCEFTIGRLRDANHPYNSTNVKECMEFNIKIPTITTILEKGISINLASRGNSWSECCLGEKRHEVGVYVIHHQSKIKYVGKTNGKKMSFGIRLRRHFQESAAGKHTYPKFAEINTSQNAIQVSLFCLSEIKEEFVSFTEKIEESWSTEIVPLFESALIVALEPEFQTQNLNS